MELLAWHAANVMNVHLRRPITVKKLLGKDRVMGQIEREQQFAKLIQLMPQRGGEIIGKSR